VERVRIVTAVFCVLLLAQIIRSVRREHIRVEYSMVWFGAALLLLVLSLSETALGWVERLLGVHDSSFVLLAVAGVLFLSTFFRSTMDISALKDQAITVGQKIGMMEWEIKRQEKEIQRLRDEIQRREQRSPPGAEG
jgi:hypothetical protein